MIKKYIEKVGITNIKDVSNNMNTLKVKATVVITMGSLNEEKFETISNLEKLNAEVNF